MKLQALAVVLVMVFASTVLAEDTTMTPAEADKLEKFANTWVDVMVKHQADCPKMGKEMTALLDANEAWLKKLADAKKTPPAATKERIGKRVGDMMTAYKKCKDDTAVKAAFDRFTSIGVKRKVETKQPETPQATFRN